MAFLSGANHHFAIASHLLGDPNQLAWSNLGYWHNTNNYQVACEQLAQQVGAAAKLQPDDYLLDLGCGQGASLLYWAAQFSVQQMSAFELQERCVENIRGANLTQLKSIYVAAFDQLPLPDPNLYQAFDAVVCVDAAYHAKLTDFLNLNCAALKPQGRLAFSTLAKSAQWSQVSGLSKTLLKKLTLGVLNKAYIPAEHLLNLAEIKHSLEQYGFIDVNIEIMDKQVLLGFANYIKQQQYLRYPQLGSSRLDSSRLADFYSNTEFADWLKIKMTVQLCAFLAKYALINYVLVSARLAE